MKERFLLMILSLASGCLSVRDKPYDSELPGRYYRIKAGDRLETLAQKSGIDIDEIMDINGITNAKTLRIGQAIFLPDPDPIGTKIKKSTKKKTPVNPEHDESSAHKIMEFPVPSGRIVREFSRSKKQPYDGIGISAARGEKVLAALDGQVIFVGDDGTKFGLIVIIEHQSPYITVYTHLDKALVTTGQLLKQKSPLGLVGISGGVSSPRLHFQVRVKQRPRNPRLFLKGH